MFIWHGISGWKDWILMWKLFLCILMWRFNHLNIFCSSNNIKTYWHIFWVVNRRNQKGRWEWAPWWGGKQLSLPAKKKVLDVLSTEIVWQKWNLYFFLSLVKRKPYLEPSIVPSTNEKEETRRLDKPQVISTMDKVSPFGRVAEMIQKNR